MPRRLCWTKCLALGVVLLAARPAGAVITADVRLREVLSATPFIFTAKVDKLYPEKPAVVLKADESLKGKPPFERLPVNLTGDAESKKMDHSAAMLKRLAPDLPVVLFVTREPGKRFKCFGYSNGTWFQLAGYTDKDDPSKVTWAFLHCEPYLRRTFKGTTAELKQVVVDGLAGKKDPPDIDAKAKPGLGPEVEQKGSGVGGQGSGEEEEASAGLLWPSNLWTSSRRLFPSPLYSGERGRGEGAVVWHVPAPSPPTPLPRVQGRGEWSIAVTDNSERVPPSQAVIPTVFIMGPLALLATLFPAVFGGFQKRWLVLLSIISLDSTLYVLYFLFRGHVKDYWWGSLPVLWFFMALVAHIGVLWSLRRYWAAVKAGEADALVPRRSEARVLAALALIGFGVTAYALARGSWLNSPYLELLALWAVVWAGTLYALYFRRSANGGARRTVVATESVMLWTLFLACTAEGAFLKFRVAGPASDGDGKGVRLAWQFEPKARGQIDSTPCIVGDRLYVAAAHREGFSNSGAVYCLDRATGKEIWSFTNDGDLRQIFSSPCVVAGKLYIGEGYHQDAQCRLFCLDATTGKKIWDFETASHTEATPCVVDGKVYLGAGDDGVYCLDATSGQKLWQYKGPHVDTNPAVVNGRLYAGSGYGEFKVFCLDAATGKPVWEMPLDLPAFGSPTASGDRVYFGLGNGNLLESDDKPAGALLCVDAQTGRRLWRYDAADAVHGQPAAFGDRVYFGSRDHHLYAVEAKEGRLLWKQDLGSPVVTAPALSGGKLYAVATGGLVCCLDTEQGGVRWKFDVAEQSQVKPQILSSPVQAEGRLYFGAGLDNFVAWTAAVYCLEE